MGFNGISCEIKRGKQGNVGNQMDIHSQTPVSMKHIAINGTDHVRISMMPSNQKPGYH